MKNNMENKNKSVPYETLGALKDPFLIAAKQTNQSGWL